MVVEKLHTLSIIVHLPKKVNFLGGNYKEKYENLYCSIRI